MATHFWWKAFQRLVAKYHRICLYERSGSRTIEPSKAARRTAEAMACELKRACWLPQTCPGRILVVAHSYGGIIAREFLALVASQDCTPECSQSELTNAISSWLSRAHPMPYTTTNAHKCLADQNGPMSFSEELLHNPVKPSRRRSSPRPRDLPSMASRSPRTVRSLLTEGIFEVLEWVHRLLRILLPLLNEFVSKPRRLFHRYREVLHLLEDLGICQYSGKVQKDGRLWTRRSIPSQAQRRPKPH
jgi:hypothetical protein